MVAIVAIGYIARDVFVAVVLALVISAALDPFVDWLERRRIPRLIGTLAVYIMVLFVIALILYIVMPIFLTQINSILENSQDVFGNLIESFGIQSTALQTIISAINTYSNSLLGGQTTLVSFISEVLGGLLLALIVFGISFYLTIDRDGVGRLLKAMLPVTEHARTMTVYDRIRKKISQWFMGQVFLSLFIGTVTFIGLTILHVPYAFVLSVAAASFELVPYVGPIFAGGLAVLTALSVSSSLALYTFILFVVIQQIEGHVIIPLVNKYTTNLNPVIVITALLIGGKVLGVAGVIIAVPIAVLFQELIRHWSEIKAGNNLDSPLSRIN